MIVKGSEVPQAAIDSAEEVISRESFGFAQVKRAITNAWREGTNEQHDRSADRLIRKAKRARRIEFDGVVWRRMESIADGTD